MQPTTPYSSAIQRLTDALPNTGGERDSNNYKRHSLIDKQEGYLRALADLAPQLAERDAEKRQDDVLIERLQEQSEAKDATIKALTEALEAFVPLLEWAKGASVGPDSRRKWMAAEFTLRAALALAQKEHGNGS